MSLRRQLWVRHRQDPGLSNRRWTEKSLPPSLLPPHRGTFPPSPAPGRCKYLPHYPLLSILPHVKWYKVTASSSGVFMFLMTVQCFSFGLFFFVCFILVGEKNESLPFGMRGHAFLALAASTPSHKTDFATGHGESSQVSYFPHFSRFISRS